jgi:hypothetical protein
LGPKFAGGTAHPDDFKADMATLFDLLRDRAVQTVMPDDGLSDMNDVLLAGGGWHVFQQRQALPGASAAQRP